VAATTESLDDLDRRFWAELRAFRLVAEQDLAVAHAQLLAAERDVERTTVAEQSFLTYLGLKHGANAVADVATGALTRPPTAFSAYSARNNEREVSDQEGPSSDNPLDLSSIDLTAEGAA